MTTAPVISVALAAYEGAPFLRAQLDSIYQPCGVALEVVAADDGSTDDTRAILQEYARTHGLRDVTDGVRRGLVGNFAHVLRKCRGEYIALADQDDLWLEGRLDQLRAALGDFDAVYSLIDRVIRPDGTQGDWSAPAGIREFAEKHGTGRPTRFLIAANWVISHTMLLRRSVLERALPIPAAQPFHDAWLALAAASGAGIRYLKPSGTLYRQHHASVTASAAPARRRFLGIAAGLGRDAWRAKCRAEIARLEDVQRAAFLADEDRAFAARLQRYYQRGLRRGLSMAMGLEARHLARFYFPAWDRRLRRNFVLRGWLGAI